LCHNFGSRNFTRHKYISEVKWTIFIPHYYAPAPRVGALSDDARLTSDGCLSLAYIGPKSRTERPRTTKFGTEVAHVTRDT